MENDCVSDQIGAPAFVRPAAPSWAWIYELRPPSPHETFSCETLDPEHCQLLHAAANPDAGFNAPMLFEHLLERGDFEAACVAAVLGMRSVFEAGCDFREFAPWHQRVVRLLAKPELSALGRSALLMQNTIAQLLGPGQMSQIREMLDAFGEAAELADSDAHRILHASLRGYCELMSGRLQIADAIVRDALFFSPEPSAHPSPKLHLYATLSLINTLRNNPGEVLDYSASAIANPAFDHLHSSLWLICMGHRLLVLAVANQQTAELDSLADRIRGRSIPSHKHYFRSYTHYALGAAALLTGHPEAALFHANTAIDMARRCHSPVAERTASLLAIQAMADLGQHQVALDLLASSRDTWINAGAHLLIASGAIEEAHLNLELGRPDQARTALQRAHNALPIGEALPCNLRRQSFISTLQLRLSEPAQKSNPPDPRPVQITTFGELCVQINGTRLYDRDWHGTRTKTLLKALIVLGGYKVSAERLCDMLWPDADGDVARNNLKVALWRLRHLGCEKGETPLPWVVAKSKHVSLVSGLCRIDCIEFQHALEQAETSRNIGLLHATLLTMRANFLSNDDSETWIIEHREMLLRNHLRASHLIAEAAKTNTNLPSPGPILENLLRLAPADQHSQALLRKLELSRL